MRPADAGCGLEVNATGVKWYENLWIQVQFVSGSNELDSL